MNRLSYAYIFYTHPFAIYEKNRPNSWSTQLPIPQKCEKKSLWQIKKKTENIQDTHETYCMPRRCEIVANHWAIPRDIQLSVNYNWK